MTIFKSLNSFCLALVTLLVIANVATAGAGWSLLAQDEEDAPSNTPRGAVLEDQSKSFVVEGLGVAVLCGASLFAICRGSVRGR